MRRGGSCRGAATARAFFSFFYTPTSWSQANSSKGRQWTGRVYMAVRPHNVKGGGGCAGGGILMQNPEKTN